MSFNQTTENSQELKQTPMGKKSDGWEFTGEADAEKKKTQWEGNRDRGGDHGTHGGRARGAAASAAPCCRC